ELRAPQPMFLALSGRLRDDNRRARYLPGGEGLRPRALPQRRVARRQAAVLRRPRLARGESHRCSGRGPRRHHLLAYRGRGQSARPAHVLRDGAEPLPTARITHVTRITCVHEAGHARKAAVRRRSTFTWTKASMDLRELQGQPQQRHPWETTRARFFVEVL